MSQQSDDVKDRDNALDEHDPLAELARIVNSGSVFGLPKEEPASEAVPAPVPLSGEVVAEPEVDAVPVEEQAAEPQAPVVDPASVVSQAPVEAAPSIDYDPVNEVSAELEAEISSMEAAPEAIALANAQPQAIDVDADLQATFQAELLSELQDYAGPEEPAELEVEQPSAQEPEPQQVADRPEEGGLDDFFAEEFAAIDAAVGNPQELQATEINPSDPVRAPQAVDAVPQAPEAEVVTEADVVSEAAPSVIAAPVATVQDAVPAAVDPIALAVEDELAQLQPDLTTASAAPQPAPPAPATAEAASPPQDDFEIDMSALEAEISAAAVSGFPIVEETSPTTPADATVVTDEATGFETEFGDIDPVEVISFEGADDELAQAEAAQKKGGMKGILAIAAVLLVALLGGGIAYVIGALNGDDGNPVVVNASDDAVRVEGTAKDSTDAEPSERTVFNTVTGDETKNETRLIDTSEEPIITSDDDSDTRVILPGLSDEDVPGIATRPPSGPKTVRTVVVRPDGSVLRDEASKEAAETLNNDQKNEDVSIVASDDQPLFTPPGAETEEITPRVVETETVAAAPQPTEPDVAPETPVTETVEPVSTEGLPPIPRPNTFRAELAAAREASREEARPETPAPTPTAPAATTTTTTAETSRPEQGTGNFMVQLSAARSDEAARSTFRSLQRRYSVLAGYNPTIQRADLGDRGIYHRVRVGPFVRAEANSLCSRLKSSGGDCIVRRR